jgi:NADPH:quinone reductase-like Zn-dependent oxidoreductase
MKAIVQDKYGSPGVLKLADIDKPNIGADEVLLRVHAAGVGPDVWHLMAGMPYLVRVMGMGFSKPKIRVRGWDVSGSVEAVGEKVTEFKPGDEVFGTCKGALAEFACAKEKNLVRKPANLTFEQAAALSVSGCTALQALRDTAKVKAGQKVLVVGAAGGVGSLSVQIAKEFGAEVTGVQMGSISMTSSSTPLEDVRCRISGALSHAREFSSSLAAMEEEAGSAVFSVKCSARHL